MSQLKNTDETKKLVAAEWRAIIEPLMSIGENTADKLQHPEDPRMRHEMYRALYSQLAVGYLAMAYADADQPDFWPYLNTAFSALFPNPDFTYYVALLDDKGVYKLAGYRGSVKRILFQTGTGTFVSHGTLNKDGMGLVTGNFDIDDLPLAKDGAFEVILSPARPAGYAGPWWELKPESTYLLVRQVSYDWLNEVDGRLAIDRLDRAAAKARPDAGQLAANLKHIATWAHGVVNGSAMFVEGVRKQMGINKISYRDLTQYGGMLTQKYAYGAFDLAPDQALVISVKVPQQVRYWNIQLLDDLGFAVDWMNRHTSLNGFQAQVDKDGMFHVVLSAQDPGVPNWLDTMGYRTGAIQIRWEQCDSYPEEHITQIVNVDVVRRLLPAATPVVTAEAREATIRWRRRAVQLRKRW